MILTLNKEIFDIAVIQAAVKDYQNIAQITVTDTEAHWICNITNCVCDSNLVASEFENYIIDLMNSKCHEAY